MIRTLKPLHLGIALGLLLASVAGAQRPTPLLSCATSCNQWTPCEITLPILDKVLRPEDALYAIRVRADISGTTPGGATIPTKSVPGFYFDRNSGGQGIYKVRFTPLQAGSYHYSSVSTTSSLNGKQGDFTCGNRLPLPIDNETNHGFLRRDPLNPYSFVWDDDPNNHFFMMGQTYYQIVNQARRNTDNDSAWKNAVNQTKTFKMNKIRLLVSPWNENPFTRESQPFCNNDTMEPQCESALSGQGFDFTRINLDHFVALDEVVHYLFGKGINAEIIIFRDLGDVDMVSANMDQNKQYLRYVVARYAAYPNVTWSLSNEWQNTSLSKAQWDTLGNCVRSGCTDNLGRSVEADPWILDPGGTKRRPLTIHPRAQDGVGKCFSFFDSTWPNSGSLQYGRGQRTSLAGYESIACNRRTGDAGSCTGGTVNRQIPYANDEYGYIGHVNAQQHRNLLWGIVTGGGFGTAGDARTVTAGCPGGGTCLGPIQSTIWVNAAQYTDIQRLVDFISTKNVPYWSMSPRDVCPESNNIHTLGNTSTRRFLVYFAAEGSSPASQVPAGNYSAVWLNPRTNAQQTVLCAPYNNGVVTAPPPGVSACTTGPCDWVVYLTGC